MAKTEFEYECGEYTTTEDKVVSKITLTETLEYET